MSEKTTLQKLAEIQGQIDSATEELDMTYDKYDNNAHPYANEIINQKVGEIDGLRRQKIKLLKGRLSEITYEIQNLKAEEANLTKEMTSLEQLAGKGPQ